MEQPLLHYTGDDTPNLQQAVGMIKVLSLQIPEISSLMNKARETGEIEVQFLPSEQAEFGAFWCKKNRTIGVANNRLAHELVLSVLFELHNAINPNFPELDQCENAEQYALLTEQVEFEHSYKPFARLLCSIVNNEQYHQVLAQLGFEVDFDVVDYFQRSANETFNDYIRSCYSANAPRNLGHIGSYRESFKRYRQMSHVQANIDWLGKFGLWRDFYMVTQKDDFGIILMQGLILKHIKGLYDARQSFQRLDDELNQTVTQKGLNKERLLANAQKMTLRKKQNHDSDQCDYKNTDSEEQNVIASIGNVEFLASNNDLYNDIAKAFVSVIEKIDVLKGLFDQVVAKNALKIRYDGMIRDSAGSAVTEGDHILCLLGKEDSKDMWLTMVVYIQYLLFSQKRYETDCRNADEYVINKIRNLFEYAHKPIYLLLLEVLSDPSCREVFSQAGFDIEEDDLDELRRHYEIDFEEFSARVNKDLSGSSVSEFYKKEYEESCSNIFNIHSSITFEIKKLDVMQQRLVAMLDDRSPIEDSHKHIARFKLFDTDDLSSAIVPKIPVVEVKNSQPYIT